MYLVKKPLSHYGRYVKTFKLPSLTKQAFKDDCDINNIMAKWQVSGLVEHVNKYNGDYSSMPDVTDYHESMNKVLSANEMFSNLPSRVRTAFDNEPSNFLNALNNPEYKDLLVDLGIFKSSEEAKASEIIKPAEPVSDV